MERRASKTLGSSRLLPGRAEGRARTARHGRSGSPGPWPRGQGLGRRRALYRVCDSKSSVADAPTLHVICPRAPNSGLATRTATQDPKGRWAIGNWFSDPLRRSGWLNDGSEERYGKQLWGAADRWTFRWNGFPYVEDVATSLTPHQIGIPGATMHDAGDRVEVRLGDATLSLHGRRAPLQPTLGQSSSAGTT